MSNALKDILRGLVQHTEAYCAWVNYRRKQVADKWEKAGSVLPPHYVKEQIIRTYQKRYHCDIFVETGTCYGEMVFAVRRLFNEIHTIELDHNLAEKAKKRFPRNRHIHVHQGDSALLLPQLLAKVDKPVLFWLDAHYSGGLTAKAALNTPIVAELTTIFKHRPNGHVILIDDAREFVGKNDYPALEELKKIVENLAPSYSFETDMDVIRISP